MDHVVDLAPLFRRELELCAVTEGELVALLVEPRTRPSYVAAAAGGAASLGAQVFAISVPGMGSDSATVVKGMGGAVPLLARPTKLAEAVADALRPVDLVVDLTLEAIIHVPLREQLREAGCRIISINEPPDVLERMFPSQAIKRAVLTLREIVLSANELQITSPGGTDISYELSSDTPLPGQYGFADEPGRWDHWPSALVSPYPVDGSANGRVVLSPGDILFPFKRYVQAPVDVTVENGTLTAVEGGLEAELIRGYLDSFEEPAVYSTSHVAIGLHPRAQWTALEFYEKDETHGMDARCVPGGVVFSTGPNRWTGRWVEAHLDVPMRGCDLLLDGKPLIRAGQLVDERLELVVAGSPPTRTSG